MSYAAYKMMHPPTGINNCASGFITHSPADFTPRIPPTQADDLDSVWPPSTATVGPIPNLVVTAANVLEVYVIRVREDGSGGGSRELVSSAQAQRGGIMAGVSGASLELVCSYRLHGNVDSMAVLSFGGIDGGRRRDSIILAFENAKISVLEFDDSIHGLRTSSMHCFEGPEWLHLNSYITASSSSPLHSSHLCFIHLFIYIYTYKYIENACFFSLINTCVTDMATEIHARDRDSFDEASEMLSAHRRCCFCIPYRSSRSAGFKSWWDKIRTAEVREGSLWSRGISALKKLREWSEIVAGPKWKTFIRRFNRSKSLARQSSKFQYDPLSYALNFDEGPGQNGDSEVENEYMFRNFSSRYATIPMTAKASMDLGKDGPNFV